MDICDNGKYESKVKGFKVTGDTDEARK